MKCTCGADKGFCVDCAEDQIADLTAKLEAMTGERDHLKGITELGAYATEAEYNEAINRADKAEASLTTAQAEIVRLREALEVLNDMHNCSRMGDIISAALTGEEEKNGDK
jgi:hypothetical protein